MSPSHTGALARAIRELGRALAATTPAPRGLPYLGLERASPTGAHLLDALSTRGIFRKYELVLELGAGLGGTARWLAAWLGCDVVGTAACAAEAAAATELARPTGVATQVRFVPARPDALPFRDARFTHVWIVEALAAVPDPGAALAEAHRALRPGGTIAVQELVARTDGEIDVAGRRFATADACAARLATAGFVELDYRDRTADRAERSSRVAAARAQLLRRLAADGLGPLVAERVALEAALDDGRLGVAQLVGRRAP